MLLSLIIIRATSFIYGLLYMKYFTPCTILLNFCNAALHLSFCCEICTVNWLWLLRKIYGPVPLPLCPLAWALVAVPIERTKDNVSIWCWLWCSLSLSSHLFHQIHRIIFTSIVEPTHSFPLFYFISYIVDVYISHVLLWFSTVRSAGTRFHLRLENDPLPD